MVIDEMAIGEMVIEGVIAEIGTIVQEITATATTTVGEAAIVIAITIGITIGITIAIEIITDATLTGHVPIGGSDGIAGLIARVATFGDVSDS